MTITAMAFTKRKTSQEDSRSGAQIAFTRDDQGLDTVPPSAPAAGPEGGPVRHRVILGLAPSPVPPVQTYRLHLASLRVYV